LSPTALLLQFRHGCSAVSGGGFEGETLVFRFAVKSHPAILAAAGCCAALLVSIAFAQAPPPKQKPPAAVQPYEKVAITLPTALNDASFDAFRKQLADVATRSDKAGLANLVINEGFFWKRDARERLDKADKKKSGIDNLTVALQLNAKDGSGWYQLVLYAFDTTAAPVEGINGVICSPPDPTYNQQDFEALLQTTKTHAEEWGYVLINNIEVRSGRRSRCPCCLWSLLPARPAISPILRSPSSATTSSAIARMRTAGKSSVSSAANNKCSIPRHWARPVAARNLKRGLCFTASNPRSR